MRCPKFQLLKRAFISKNRIKIVNSYYNFKYLNFIRTSEFVYLCERCKKECPDITRFQTGTRVGEHIYQHLLNLIRRRELLCYSTRQTMDGYR